MGYQAARNATCDDISQGSIGAGTGATVGKFAGEKQSMKGGIGSASIHLGNNIIIGALVVVNALGNIIDPETHQTIAGARNPEDGSFLDPMDVLKSIPASIQPALKNTTLAVIATNAALGKEDVTKIAQMAHDGFARAINPAHTQFDGDIIFMLAAESGPACNTLLAGTAAAETVAAAIARSVRIANQLES
jgi:L-aminopeptidase/D-esterase-like protein